MSQHHERIKNDPRWKHPTTGARALTLERDGYTCTARGPRCLVTAHDGIPLEVDHILPLAEYPELAFELENLTTLCRHCHQDKAETGTTALVRYPWTNPNYSDLAELLDASVNPDDENATAVF